MARDKSKDDKYFNCKQEHEFEYVSGLYEEKDKVYDYLKAECEDSIVKYSTHEEVYKMIEKDLGYPVPN